MTWEERIQKLQVTPDKPGVYLLKDPADAILYVGKASSLKTRLRHYFSSPAKLVGKQKHLIKRVSDFDYVVTGSETEALMLENTYIKRYKPHYNIRLKDDKTYPYIKINLKEDFPKPHITRERLKDSAQYFGPYTNVKSIRQTMNLLNRLFPYRTCSKTITGTDPRPCLEFYINRCAAPCTGEVSSAQYHEIINQLINFLNGNTKDVTKSLKNSMNSASQSMEYEKAARLRDQIRSITHITETQTTVSKNKENIDVLGLAIDNSIAWVEVLHVRYGTVTGRDNFQMVKINNEDTGSILGSFIKQFYDKSPQIPHLILSQVPIPDLETVSSWLATVAKRKVKLNVPKRGKRLQLLRLANTNASYGLKKLKFQSNSNAHTHIETLQSISHLLNLQKAPNRIECFDISNIQGTDSVGSMVVFIGGKPHKPHYRKFTIKSIDQPNDYAMMKEVLHRRLSYIIRESHESSFGQIPDLILIDGGKGHLSAGIQVLEDMGLTQIPLASIAKREEQVFIPDNPAPINLAHESPEMHLIQRIRDEAHRFAITFHRLKRSKRSVYSALDTIPGIGSIKKKHLMEKFSSIQNIRGSEVEEIASIPGINIQLAKLIKQHLRVSSSSVNHTHRKSK